ncbi:MAG: hypothetical protein BMS9Abin26_1604 [Gammaproteobacteria bacterium]|nr:MAG: hypothetical protein BMS9Abin26_1604 [Gammaproteobacteria bacterium]
MKKITCNEVFDISTIGQLHKQLRKALATKAKKKCLTLDGSQVERTDAAAVQLLYAFIREATSRDIEITWHEPSESLLSSIRLMGLESSMSLPINEIST